MQTEKEVKVLNVDVLKIKEKLIELNASFEGEFLQKRYTFDTKPQNPNKWMRLRTNGKKSTLTIKEIVDTTKVDGVKEWEIEVSSFEETKRILFELGFEHKHYQENTRAIYNLNGVEITIDKWPLIPAYLEIEGQSVDAVLQTVDLLEVDKNNVTTDDVVEVYKKYGIDILSIKELKEN